MIYPSKKNQLALAITLAISICVLSGCSTSEQKLASNNSQPLPVEHTVNKTSGNVKTGDGVKTEVTPIIANTAQLMAPLISSENRAKQQQDKLSSKKLQYQFNAEPKMLHRFQPLLANVVASRILPLNSEIRNRENYAHYDDSGINLVAETPVSTFSIDVDTGAYTNVRRILNQGQLPPKDAVRAEEFINYFSYDIAPPHNSNTPFAVHTEMMQTPWNNNSYLLQIGIKAWQSEEPRPDANLVFLVDVSGSMRSTDKLGLLKKSLSLLTRQLTANDRISIVVYAGASGIILEPTAGNLTAEIELALGRLRAGGSTNGAAGIKLAYQMAEKSFIKGGINRILLATDGDFNVGTTNFNALIDLVEEKRKSGIALSTLGFGSGNYNDHLMEQLADKGNGQYSYIDSLLEAKKVLLDEMNASLLTVASDVKIQLEFNPQVVSEYRLIGYENRILARADFNNDNVDAGDIGAGHTVTALYEIRFADSSQLSVDPLRYANSSSDDGHSNTNPSELGFLKLRYKNPGESRSKLIKLVLNKSQLISSGKTPSDSIQFAASVAAFAQQLRGGKHLQNFSYRQIGRLAQTAKGDDLRGLRAEFIQLVSLAELLSQKPSTLSTTSINHLNVRGQ